MQKSFKPFLCRIASCGSLVMCSAVALAQPSQSGQSGFIQMPSGRLHADGTLQLGVSVEPIYQALWTNVTLLPWLELSARYTRIDGVDGGLGSSYGDYKDKAFDGKLQLLTEGKYRPSLVIGAQDFLGTGIFQARYVAAAKRFGNLDASLGFGQQRIDGWFAGLNYDVEAVRGLSLVAEYNAFDYARDYASTASGVAGRDKGIGLGLGYQWGWLGSQLSWQDQRWGVNASVSVPLQTPDFIPKLDEPKPYDEVHYRPDDQQWRANPEHQQRLLLALRTQDYSGIGIDYRDRVLHLRLGNTRISHISRAIGRAARTALALGPEDAESLEIVFTQADLPVATLTFSDMATLNAYFQGLVGPKALMDTVVSRYATARDVQGHAESTALLQGMSEGPRLASTRGSDSGHLLMLEGKRSVWYDSIALAPRAGFFFNDPSGALHYDLILEASWLKRLSRGLVADSTLGYTVLTDMDEVRTGSNSRLPHVRSDIATYRRGSDFKLVRLMLNQVWPMGERFYARVGAGLYEEMYGGAGVQGLYVWPGSKVALDLSLDALRQRDYRDPLRFLDYRTTTSIASLHVRLPYGVTGTLRAGRFLAGDEALRFEFKRRFRSGYEVGAWYSHSRTPDTTTPGSAADPYQDKGIYFSVPLNTLLTRDTSAEGSYRLRPWTRDGAQMVNSALDLYEVLEKPLMMDFPELREQLERQGGR